MQEVKGGGMFSPGRPPFGGFGGKKTLDKQDIHKAASFGLEFPWAKCNVELSGQSLRNVGIRYRGNYAYILSKDGMRRSMKISFDRQDEEQLFLGMEKINLSSGITDTTRSREALTFALFRAAGVPAPRTAYVDVIVTAPGKYNNEFVGLCTVIEQVDKRFLKENFDNGKGMLLKPEGLRGIDYLGPQWEPYDKFYRVKGQSSKKEKQRLIDFAWLVNRADDERFQKEIESFVDIDNFLRYLAMSALLANLDSYLGYGHNYYLYLRNDTNKFAFIPWDTDQSFGMWPAGGPVFQQMNLSIYHPHLGENKLIDRLLAMEKIKSKYTEIVRELTTTCFTKKKLNQDINAVQKATKVSLDNEALAMTLRKETPVTSTGAGAMYGKAPALTYFVDMRLRSVESQLSGRSRGYVPPALNMGRPGGFGR